MSLEVYNLKLAIQGTGTRSSCAPTSYLEELSVKAYESYEAQPTSKVCKRCGNKSTILENVSLHKQIQTNIQLTKLYLVVCWRVLRKEE